MDKWVIVFNPKAGSNSRKRGMKLKTALENADIGHLWLESQTLEIARSDIKDLVDTGHRKFLAVGGDGTNNNTINTLLSSGIERELKYALLPWGTGNDWAVHHDLSFDERDLVRAMQREDYKETDLGEIFFINEDRSVFFTNTVGIGFDAFVVREMGKSGKIGKISYLTAILRGLRKYDSQYLNWNADDEGNEGDVFSLHIGIGPTTGGGLKITPHALDRGEKLAYTIVRSARKWKYAINLHNLLRGKIDHLTFVDKGFIDRLSFPEQEIGVHIECDGESCGVGPFEIRLSEKKLNLLRTSFTS